MANTKFTALTAGTPATSDIIPFISDPAGTPIEKKTTVSDIGTALNLSGTNTGDQTTTAGLSNSTDKNLITDAQLTVLGNTSGTNTGDQTNITGNAGTVTNGVYTTDTGTVTNTMLAGSIANSKLANGAVANLSGTNSGDQTSVTGNSGSTDALKSATTTIDVVSATAPTTGQVLTATGASAATWQTPSGGGSTTPSMKIATIFETAARFGGGANGTGSARTFDANGVTLSTGNSALGWANNYLTFPSLGYNTTEVGSPSFSTQIAFFPGTDVFFYFGIGYTPDIGTGTGDTYTGKHIGIKITRAASGNVVITATQADGTTENTATLVSNFTGSYLDLIIKVNGTSSVDYYVRENGGALSSATNLTSNLPSGVAGHILHFIKNKTVTSSSDVYLTSLSYER